MLSGPGDLGPDAARVHVLTGVRYAMIALQHAHKGGPGPPCVVLKDSIQNKLQASAQLVESRTSTRTSSECSMAFQASLAS